MEESRFGRLVRVSLEDMWNGDGREFLSWLARAENLSYLGEVVEMQLEFDTLTEEQDRRDPLLLCHDRKSNARFVVMSPVVETGDSDFGRILVYASQFNQIQMVLMAGRFQAGHLSAMNWFNRVTSKDVNLFGLEVEFWRIGNSPLAPNFTPLIVPRISKSGLAGVTSESSRGTEVAPGSPSPVRPVPEFPPSPSSESERAAPPSESVFAKREQNATPESGLPAAEPPRKPTPRQEQPETESPVTPSGMRRMFSSRGFNKSGTNNPTGESQRISTDDSDDFRHDSVVETSPIGKSRESEAQGENSDQQPAVSPSDDGYEREPSNGDAALDWPEAEATVTPSGMLQRLRVRESQKEAPSMNSESRNGSSTEDLYIEFWKQFWMDVIRWEDEPPPEKTMGQGWISFPIGREHFSLVAFLNQAHRLAGMGLVIDGSQAKSHYRQLYREKDTIESELGLELDWRELPEKQESHIYLHRKNVDISNRANWTDYQNWFADSLEAFMGVFGNRIDSLGGSILWGE